MNWGRILAASAVISAASLMDVWSFHSQQWAARLPDHFFWRARGVLVASTGIGLEPVVSTPRPITWRASKPLAFLAWARASLMDFSRPKRWSAGFWRARL